MSATHYTQDGYHGAIMQREPDSSKQAGVYSKAVDDLAAMKAMRDSVCQQLLKLSALNQHYWQEVDTLDVENAIYHFERLIEPIEAECVRIRRSYEHGEEI